ncbi:MAG: L,D-transpeptidase family protein [Rhodobacteraceae bacterium]|jgi:murein L,D-transpeptidase YafK|nr:L,D-transpeptidase family protein [Paracoccaceae bacterium]
MKRRNLILTGIAAALVSSCSSKSKFKTYRGPEVTFIVVNKSERKMFLFHKNSVLKEYDFDLGFAPIGDKFYEGDGRTPEGTYFIDRRNPNSKYHLSIGISYPNARDRAEAATLGKPPGGDIFIHGESNRLKLGKNDWTWGCIAVPNREMEEIYSMVQNGTPIKINP